MKKLIIFLFSLSMIVNLILVNKYIKLESQFQNLSKEKNNLINSLNSIEKEKEDILNKTYCACKKGFNFGDICINKIDKVFIRNNLINNQGNGTYNLFLDFGFEKDLKKLNKILSIINKDFLKIKFQELRLSCIFNFDKQTLDLLKNLKINKLFIDTEQCGFYNGKDNYDKNSLKKFFEQAKNIKEIEIGYINTDLFKKENGEIKIYKNQ